MGERRTITQARRWAGLLATAVAVMLLGRTGAAAAADWPTKPVTIIVPFLAGGSTDMMGRLAAERLSAKFGQTFVVENRGGAGGVIGATEVANAKPDGNTLLFGAMSLVTLAPMVQKTSYDPDKDLVPVTEFGTGPVILGVRANLPVNSVKDLIEYGKQNPGKLTYGAVGIQTVTTIAGGMFAHRAGIKTTLVPYKGGVQAVADLLAGHVDMYFGNAAEMLPHKTGGKMKLLAVATAQRLPQAPDLPAVAETFPGFVYGSWNGFMVPAGTPKEIVDRLVEGSIEAVNTPAVKDKLILSGIVPGGTSQEKTAEAFRQDKANFAEAVKVLGIKAE